jgi:hypothetical protein
MEMSPEAADLVSAWANWLLLASLIVGVVSTHFLITHHNQPSWRHFDLLDCEQIEGDDYGAKPHSISEGAF